MINFFHFLLLILIGYEGAKQIASMHDQGEQGDEMIVEQAPPNPEEIRYELGQKLVRFFTLSEGNYFVIFVEAGLKRKSTVTLEKNLKELILTITIPLPDDNLFRTVGFHASQANLFETKEQFTIKSPKRLKIPSSDEPIPYPNKEAPYWHCFKYEYQPDVDEKSINAEDDIISILEQKKNPPTIDNRSKVTEVL